LYCCGVDNDLICAPFQALLDIVHGCDPPTNCEWNETFRREVTHHLQKRCLVLVAPTHVQQDYFVDPPDVKKVDGRFCVTDNIGVTEIDALNDDTITP
jgi:hypothetical protein